MVNWLKCFFGLHKLEVGSHGIFVSCVKCGEVWVNDSSVTGVRNEVLDD